MGRKRNIITLGERQKRRRIQNSILQHRQIATDSLLDAESVTIDGAHVASGQSIIDDSVSEYSDICRDIPSDNVAVHNEVSEMYAVNSSDECSQDPETPCDPKKSPSFDPCTVATVALNSHNDGNNSEQSSERVFSNLISKGIQKWLKYEKKVPHASVDRLLQILSEDFPSLPKSVKTICAKNSEEVSIQQWESSEYAYFNNWHLHVKHLIKLLHLNESASKVIHLSVNIDGIPLMNASSRYAATPILVQVLECPKKIFCAAIYCTNEMNAPHLPPIERFLAHFLQDVKLLQESLLIEGLEVLLGPFVCDAPMRAAFKGIVSHTGYYSCERCCQKGQYHDRTVVYPSLNNELRSDMSFRQRLHKKHHKSLVPTPLETMKCNMVTDFILDYMHCCLLGTMKRLLTRLRSTKSYQKKVHMSATARRKFDNKLHLCSQYLPDEFNRKLEGGISRLGQWKATEFRCFLLYCGIFVLSSTSVVEKNIYKNFLCFSIALKMLLCDGQDIATIDGLMTKFIEGSKAIYGKGFTTYNVHSMTHLSQDYLKWGKLDNVSCFPFETYLGSQIKSSVRSGYKPLQQICSNIVHVNSKPPDTRDTKISCKISNTICSFPEELCKCFKKLKIREKCCLTIKAHSVKNSCVMVKDGRIGHILEIHDFSSSIKVAVSFFEVVNNFFSEPLPSSKVGVYKCTQLSENMIWIPLSFIKSKMIIFPFHSSFVTEVLPNSI